MARVQVSKRNYAVLRGEDDVREWTEEELVRGRRRDKKGKWGGRPPEIVPKVVHDELVRRKLTKAYELLADSVEDAVKVLVEIAKDREADPGVRVKAATTILDKVLPPKPHTVHLMQGPPAWQNAITGGVRSVAEIQQQLIEANAKDQTDT